MTKRQIEKLREAIRLAEGPGECKYCNGGPLCVIGQLAAIEGIGVVRMRTWGTSGIRDGATDFGRRLEAYPPALLERLQRIWDWKAEYGIETQRAEMRTAVNSWKRA